MVKTEIGTIAEKNRIIRNIISAIESGDSFLIIGHRDPDEDCIASMVAFGLLLSKFNKTACIVTCANVQERYAYLLNICKFNSIKVMPGCLEELPRVSTVVILDTPKPSMLEDDPGIRAALADPSIIHVEVDHHLAADAAYIGDQGYRLVTDASSTAELIGLLALKMQADRALLQREQIGDLLSRNFVLAVLTGIIGDSKMGKYLKTRRERWFYSMFSAIFERLLAQKTEKDRGNFASMQQVFAAIQALSNSEAKCYQYLMSRKQLTGAIGRIVLDQSASKELFWRFGAETVVAVAKAAADNLAEENGRLGLIGYYDDPALTDLVQFRLRRSKNFSSFDLRTILEKFGIANGGGHPGAIGFRFPRRDIEDIEAYAASLIIDLERMTAETGR